ncbi:ABC transporter ATP-binding protein [Pimelobacter simplex]|uniref:ABC transporter ATP-binding protein n=1 Tax=Nocardioides simplex TaxID=2045 RepID=UPI0021503EF7|nr:ABC transporter ATP-binding protein [Pimelobacter simplex]UUW90465.1 ABC transporter ATP-binding protein [Pimelobacter simplex]UUW94295.1 ABC transporter ATP-binding protein [Pimelobacter simplex]
MIPALRMAGITKHFNGVPACLDVDLEVAPGEIHGLLGQNGAGKSTLMNILLGLVRPDRGEVSLAGEPAVIRDPNAARALGVRMVHQHYSLIPTLSVWENVVLSGEGRVDRDRTITQIEEVSERFGLEVSPRAMVGDLSVGEQQRVELVTCLIDRPRLLVLDEPTAVLTRQESRSLFTMLRGLVEQEECSVILISHNLAEITAVSHNATVMRGGRVVSRVSPKETPVAELARHMIGRDLPSAAQADVAAAIGAGTAPVADAPAAAAEPEQLDTPPVLSIVGATASADGTRALDSLDLEIRAGEIVGVAGVEGNGQQWLSALLAGSLSLQGGEVRVHGKRIAVGRPGSTRKAGVGVVPEDRKTSGCILDMSVADNLALAGLKSLSRAGVVSRRKLHSLAERLVEEFDIAVASVDQPMRSLSGGNQQKVVLAREMSAAPAVLVLAQPTRGLDVGAVADLHERMRQAAAAGVAVLLISSDLNEIMQLSDRIAVIYRGRIQGELARAEADPEKLGLLMGGVSA